MNKDNLVDWNYRSTNGRWGVTVVAPKDIKFPCKGNLTYLGKCEGMDLYKFIPSEEGDWIEVIEADIETLVGCKVVTEMDLQSSCSVTIVAGGDFYSYKKYGYKGRSSRIVSVNNGEYVDLPPSVMVAMGLIPPEKEEEKVDTTPPPLEGSLAEALRKAGF